ncbi:MAG: radical SAM protein, partial [Planctomycetes bacterium]|nr:radical SAM protein [Planctomycetota bacterium]
LTPELAEGLVQAGLDTVCLSVDTVGEEGVFHGDEDVTQTIHAFTFLRDAAKSVGRKLSIGVEFVIMRDTAESLSRSLDWAVDQGAEFALVSHMLPYGEDMADQELFNPNTDQSMAEFARWQAEAEERGLDFSQYFDILWKFYKTSDQAELARFVMEHHKDALRRGIPMHFANLMAWSTPEKVAEQAWLSNILAEARTLADRRGLDLTLPPVMAVHDRKCDFVE